MGRSAKGNLGSWWLLGLVLEGEGVERRVKGEKGREEKGREEKGKKEKKREEKGRKRKGREGKGKEGKGKGLGVEVESDEQFVTI